MPGGKSTQETTTQCVTSYWRTGNLGYLERRGGAQDLYRHKDAEPGCAGEGESGEGKHGHIAEGVMGDSIDFSQRDRAWNKPIPACLCTANPN